MAQKKTPNLPSLDELRKLRKPIKQVNVEHKKRLRPLERLAIWITAHVGSMGFFLIILTWTLFWLLWNSFGPTEKRFDPFPAFVLWLFISNMIQIMLMPLIMVGQNLQSRHAETRAESDYDVNMRSAREIEAILMHLEYQNKTLADIKEQLSTSKNGQQ